MKPILRLVPLAALGLLCAGQALSETRSLLLASGDWAVYRVSDFEYRFTNGEIARLPDTCLAETGITGGAVRILLPPEELGDDVRGMADVIISSDR